MARNRFRVMLADEDLGVFDERQLTLTDAFTIEGTTGLTVNEMLGGLGPMRAKSLRALVWFMRFKQPGDTPHITTIDFNLTDLSYEELIEEADPTVASPEPDETGTSGSSPTSAT